ncbi:hypothetical protein SprV_0301148000 [Sparganum proliferum]
MFSANAPLQSPYTITPPVDHHPVKFEMDTGSAVTLINEASLQKLPSLLPASSTFRSYTGQNVEVRGVFTAEVEHDGELHYLPVQVKVTKVARWCVTMDQKLLSSLSESAHLGNIFPTNDASANIILKANSRIPNVMNFAVPKFQSEACRQIYCWGLSGGMGKAVACAEDLKSAWTAITPETASHSGSSLFQFSRIFSHAAETTVDGFTVKSVKPAIVIILSKDPPLDRSLSNLIPPPGSDAQSSEVPIRSQRQSKHLKKKRRNQDDRAPSSAPHKKARSKKGNQPAMGSKDTDARTEEMEELEGVVSFCHRLIPASKTSKAAVELLLGSCDHPT